jgi:hypothetical protein
MCDHFGGWYVTLGDLHDVLNRCRSGRICDHGLSGQQVYPHELWHRWGAANLTVLDEIGIRAPTDAQYETLKVAIDRRIGKPSVVISNLALAELAKVYDVRIASRLSKGTIMTLTGDRRRSK